MSQAPTGLEPLLEEMMERRASDLHLTAGDRPRLRVDGRLEGGGPERALTGEDTAALAREILDEEGRARLCRERELDLAFGVDGLGRFRANVFHQRDRVALAIRSIPGEIRSFRELGLPPVVRSLATRPRGLVLITGPTGSGKSTTLATMVDAVNRERRCHVVTIEDPVEHVHRHKRSLVNQRQVGADTPSFADGLRSALRQDPDVILIGEMRDLETIGAALTAAETGHLVLATLHTHSAAESVNRVIDVFPPHRQDQVRAQLAAVLEGVVAQALLPRSAGPGRALATEVLVATPAVRTMIRDQKTHQLESAMQTGARHGMRTLDDSLAELSESGEVALDDCLRVSRDPEALRRRCGGREEAVG